MKNINRVIALFISIIIMFVNTNIVQAVELNSNINIDIESEHIGCEYYYDSNSIEEGEIKKSNNPYIPSEVNNIVILIRFSDEDEFVNDKKMNILNENYNGLDKSLNTYINELTYGYSDVDTTFYPKDQSGNYISYKHSKPRSYYKTKSKDNANGYEEYQKREREMELLSAATEFAKSQIELTPEQLDTNGDGSIDNVTFLISRLPESHGDLLWPHKSDFSGGVRIKDKSINKYNLLLQGTDNVGVMGRVRDLGVIVHEFLHSFYFPDLYRYNGASRGANPVGVWDIMATTPNEPQLPLVYTRVLYSNIAKKMPVITKSGEYRLKPSNSNDINDTVAYKIKSPGNDSQFFMVEYRKLDDRWDSVIKSRNPGLLVYRVDERIAAANGNTNGHPDYMYVFRAGATSNSSADGDIDGAIISPLDGETSIGTKDPLGFNSNNIYYQDGSNSEIVINDIKFTESGELSFNIEFPEIEGDGTSSNPFIIRDAEGFNKIRNNTKSHYKLANDINMSNIKNFNAIPEFSGVIDGDGYSVSGININNPGQESIGIFNDVRVGGIVKNINFTDVNIIGKVFVGGVTSRNQGIIDNVTIDGNVEAIEGWVSGLSNDNSGTISNCISTMNVIGDDYVGGIVSNNYHGKIINSIFDGVITARVGNKIGGITARNYIPESVVENCYWNVTKSGVEVAASEGWGDYTKNMVGTKLPTEILLKTEDILKEEIQLIGDTSIVNFENIKVSSENDEIVKIKRDNNILLLEGISGGNTKISITLNVGEKEFVLQSNIIVEEKYKKEDINKDTVVDVLDLAIISSHYNKYSVIDGYKPQYDLNKDGIIDVYDIVQISKLL